jgi:hypothetical protein
VKGLGSAIQAKLLQGLKSGAVVKGAGMCIAPPLCLKMPKSS